MCNEHKMPMFIFYLYDINNNLIAFTHGNIWGLHRGTFGQLMAGTKREYRNKGIMKWLKAELISKVLELNPEIEYMETGSSCESTGLRCHDCHRVGRMGFANV